MVRSTGWGQGDVMSGGERRPDRRRKDENTRRDLGLKRVKLRAPSGARDTSSDSRISWYVHMTFRVSHYLQYLTLPDGPHPRYFRRVNKKYVCQC